MSDFNRSIIIRRRAAFIAASLAGAGCAGAGERAEPIEEVSSTHETAALDEPTAAPREEPPSLPPAPTAVVQVCLSITIMPRVAFAHGATAPTAESLAVIAAAYETLAAHPRTRIAIEGHRDAGERDLANRLARERAKGVERELTARGIDPARLCTVDFGDSRPLTPGRTDDERAQNRRVSFRVLAGDERCP